MKSFISLLAISFISGSGVFAEQAPKKEKIVVTDMDIHGCVGIKRADGSPVEVTRAFAEKKFGKNFRVHGKYKVVIPNDPAQESSWKCTQQEPAPATASPAAAGSPAASPAQK